MRESTARKSSSLTLLMLVYHDENAERRKAEVVTYWGFHTKCPLTVNLLNPFDPRKTDFSWSTAESWAVLFVKFMNGMEVRSPATVNRSRETDNILLDTLSEQ